MSRERREIQTIFVTHNFQDISVFAHQNAGICTYLKKPFGGNSKLGKDTSHVGLTLTLVSLSEAGKLQFIIGATAKESSKRWRYGHRGFGDYNKFF